MTTKAAVSVRGGKAFRLLPAEAWMMSGISAIGVLAVLITIVLQRDVNWPPFLAGFAGTIGLAAIGAYVRQTKGAPRIALALVGTAIFSAFTAVSAVFIFALFPLSNSLIDPMLIQVDALLGYHWPSLVAWLATVPRIAAALGYVYHSSLAQMLVTILILAALSREAALHRFLLAGIISLVLAVAIWWIVPSVGPSAFQQIPESDRLATGLYFSPAYGEYLLHLVNTGPGRISPEVVTGVVAFPSYHMVMALLVVWYTRGTLAFWPACLINAAMVPATLSHGGHHLVDLVGGVLVFAVAAWLASRLIAQSSPR